MRAVASESCTELWRSWTPSWAPKGRIFTLENALEAGSIDLPDAIDLQNLPQDVQANYRGVQDINLRLQAIDQLSHALQQPADLPACALVLNGLIADLPNCGPEQRANAMEHLSAWAELRQLPSAIPALLAHGSTVAEPGQLTADGPPEPPLLAPFLMWFLAENRPQIAENKPWNETLNGIMMGAGFPFKRLDPSELVVTQRKNGT